MESPPSTFSAHTNTVLPPEGSCDFTLDTVTEWNGMERNGMERNGTEWKGMEGNGMERNGTEWNGMEWNGMEQNGAEWKGMERNGTERYGKERKRMEQNITEWNGMERNGTERCQCKPHLAEIQTVYVTLNTVNRAHEAGHSHQAYLEMLQSWPYRIAF